MESELGDFPRAWCLSREAKFIGDLQKHGSIKEGFCLTNHSQQSRVISLVS